MKTGFRELNMHFTEKFISMVHPIVLYRLEFGSSQAVTKLYRDNIVITNGKIKNATNSKIIDVMIKCEEIQLNSMKMFKKG